MKLLGTTTVKKVATAVVAAVRSKPKPTTDPWLNDNARKAEVNDTAARARGEGWLGRRHGWLKSTR